MTQTDIEGKHNFEIILQWQKTKLKESLEVSIPLEFMLIIGSTIKSTFFFFREFNQPPLSCSIRLTKGGYCGITFDNNDLSSPI